MIVGGKVTTLKEGVALGVRSIESGAAGRALDRLVAITNAR
jgi:anthranilate phosphoribosyltransferase